MGMHTYIVILKSDQGEFRVLTAAQNREAAIELVLKAELAPRSAVIFAGRKPSKKELARTKAWLSTM